MSQAGAGHSTSPRRALRLLMAEDTPADAELIVALLKRAGYPLSYDVVDSPASFQQLLERSDYDIILSDHNLRTWAGTDALEILKRSGKDIPFVVVTAALGDEAAVEYIKHGAADYVLKHRLDRLAVVVNRALSDKAQREESARLQEQIVRAKREWELTFDTVPDPVFFLDKECHIQRANRAAAEVFGLSFRELIGKTCYEVLHGLGRERADCPHARLLTTGREQRGDLEEPRLGKVFDVTTTPLRDRDGVLWGCVHVVRDVTKRKLAEQRLSMQYGVARVLAESATVQEAAPRIVRAICENMGWKGGGIWEVKRRRCIAFWHDPAFSLGEFEAKTWDLRMAPGVGLTGRVWSSGKPAWITDVAQDSNFRRAPFAEKAGLHGAFAFPIRAGGEVTGIIEFFHDEIQPPAYDLLEMFEAIGNQIGQFMQRKQAEEAQRESEARYRELFENASYGIYRSSPEGKFLDLNPALARMLGYESKEEVLALSMETDVYRDPRQRSGMVEGLQEGGIEGAELEWKRKDGTPILVRLGGRVVRGEDGNMEAFEVIVEDITERRVLEKRNRQLQKFEAIGQLAGGIAHDFNNVLGVMLGWADIGLEEAPAGSRLHTHFKKIHDQGERAATLTRQLLAFARRQILEPRNINLNQTVNDVVGLLEKTIGAHIEARTVLASDLLPARADPAQVEQVLMNLCLNARDAMPQGGKLVIETGNVEFDEDYCRRQTYARPGRYVLLAVSDTGIGMDEATLERIFEPFFTTKEMGKGTGLGLATVYGIVRQHNGFVHVYSEPGRGTTFRVYLPVGTGVAETQNKAEIAPVRRGTETILVAEDNAGGREIAREVLENLGYTVLLACNGAEAVELFQAHADRIALALLDVVMPKLGGPEAYEKMRAMKPGLPVIFATGYSAETNLPGSVVEHGLSLLQKPFSPSTLGRKVREVLDLSRGSSEAHAP